MTAIPYGQDHRDLLAPDAAVLSVQVAPALRQRELRRRVLDLVGAL